jgi:peptidoglycan/LPS O-acetylase OafA/YrhL
MNHRLAKLEALRGFACAYVVLFHAKGIGKGLSVVFGYGYAAVILFFLLSGFVICLSTGRGGALDFKDYFRRRFRRIYPIFVVSLGVTYLTSCAVHRSMVPIKFNELLGNLLFLQDSPDHKAGVWVEVFQGNTPLWSLSYEWWCYMLFFAVIRLGPRSERMQQGLAMGIAACGVLSYLAIPNQLSLFASYFFIWWCGVQLAREFVSYGTVSLRRQMGTIGAQSALACVWVAGFYVTRALGKVTPLVQVQHNLAAVAILVAGLSWSHLQFWGFRQTMGLFMRVAPISYALYLLHMPAFRFGEIDFVARHASIKYVIVPVALVGMAYALEVHLQPVLAGGVDRLFAGRWLRPKWSNVHQEPALSGIERSVG